MGSAHSGEEDNCSGGDDESSQKVLLHVYNLASGYNAYAGVMGMGAYHTGVEVAGREYSFSIEGISAGVPKRCPEGVTYYKEICMGSTDKNIAATIRGLRESYSRGSYDILTKNCNNFSEAFCKRLVGKSIPSWVNRLARTGNSIDTGAPPPPPPSSSSKDNSVMEKKELSKKRNKISSKQAALLAKMKAQSKTRKSASSGRRKAIGGS